MIVFNPCTSIDFMPDMRLEDNELEVVDEIRLLGLILRSDLKWISNTENMVKKANKRLWILRRLKYLGAKDSDLVDVYIKQIRSLMELAVPVWHSGITKAEQIEIERIQKSAAHIILGDGGYVSYRQALNYLGLDSLLVRREMLCLKFAKKAERHTKFEKLFKPTVNTRNTRLIKPKYCSALTRHSRFRKSPLPFLTEVLNEYYRK